MVKHVLLEDVISCLIGEGYLLGAKVCKTRKPGHGPCCTCQECGYPHDECVCDHNALLEALLVLPVTNIE